MEFPAQQARALQSVGDWLRDPSSKQVYYLAGDAGTGKTTLARHLVMGVDGEVYFGTFTGKAAYVLRQKGCANATTIHKLIYRPKGKSVANLKELEAELEKLDPLDTTSKLYKELKRKIALEEQNLSRPAFSLNIDSVLRTAKLLVIDEVSMVDEQMAKDLESFGCKILVLGDKNQLPPVRGTGYYTEREPDFYLTEIHRQAKDSPIIALAAMVREQRLPALGNYGESRVIQGMDARMAMEAEQMLVGRNATRVAFNARVRDLKGIKVPLPVKGDKVVCLRNSQDHPLLNGSLWWVNEVVEHLSKDRLILSVTDVEDTTVECLAHTDYFLGNQPPWWARSEAEEFDYGYALTTHKAQGSQWDDVLVYDESAAFRQDRWRWLYTAVTRAAKRVTIVR